MSSGRTIYNHMKTVNYHKEMNKKRLIEKMKKMLEESEHNPCEKCGCPLVKENTSYLAHMCSKCHRELCDRIIENYIKKTK